MRATPTCEPNLIIFDCDGVLVDSEPLANRVLIQELHRIGVDMAYAEVCDRFIGLSLERCVRILAEDHGARIPADFIARVQRRTHEAFRGRLQPVAGVREALERIRLPLCVASSGEPEKIRLSLALTGLLGYFGDRLFSAAEVARGKPHPDLFLHAARVMRTRPARCVVVEDSRPGVQAAGAAGMIALGYAGRGNRAELDAAGAAVFDDMRQLPDLLGSLSGVRPPSGGTAGETG